MTPCFSILSPPPDPLLMSIRSAPSSWATPSRTSRPRRARGSRGGLGGALGERPRSAVLLLLPCRRAASRLERGDPLTGRVGGLAPVKFLARSPPLSPQLRRRQNELARENHKQLEWEGVLGPSLLDSADTVRLRHSPQADSPSRTSSRCFSPLPRSFPRQNAARCSPARGGLCVAEQNPVRCSVAACEER